MIFLYILLAINISLLLIILFLFKKKVNTEYLVDYKSTKNNNLYNIKRRVNKFKKIMNVLGKSTKGSVKRVEYTIKITENSISRNKWGIGISFLLKETNIYDKIPQIIDELELEPIFETYLKQWDTDKCLEFWYGEEYSYKLKSLEKTFYLLSKLNDYNRHMFALEYNINTKKSVEKIYTLEDNLNIFDNFYKITDLNTAIFLNKYFNKYVRGKGGVIKINNDVIGGCLYIKLPVKEIGELATFWKNNFNLDLTEIMADIKDYAFHLVAFSKCRQLDDCKNSWRLSLYYKKKIYNDTSPDYDKKHKLLTNLIQNYIS